MQKVPTFEAKVSEFLKGCEVDSKKVVRLISNIPEFVLNDNFQSMRDSLKLDKTKKFCKNDTEVPIVFLGKLFKLSNFEPEEDKKSSLVFTVSKEQHDALNHVCISAFKRAYSELETPIYLPLENENVIVKATANCNIKKWNTIEVDGKLESAEFKPQMLENGVFQVSVFVRPFFIKESAGKTIHGVSLTVDSLIIVGSYKKVKEKTIEDKVAEFIENESPKKKHKQ